MRSSAFNSACFIVPSLLVFRLFHNPPNAFHPGDSVSEGLPVQNSCGCFSKPPGLSRSYGIRIRDILNPAPVMVFRLLKFNGHIVPVNRCRFSFIVFRRNLHGSHVQYPVLCTAAHQDFLLVGEKDTVNTDGAQPVHVFL